MYDGFAAALTGWRTILHLSEWSGLSVGVIVAIAVVIWLEPRLLKPALILIAIAVFGYVCVLHGDAVGRADKQAEWDAARAAAEVAAVKRDGDVALALERTYLPPQDTAGRYRNAQGAGRAI